VVSIQNINPLCIANLKDRGHPARDHGQPQGVAPTNLSKRSMGGEQGRPALETKNKATIKK
jgi:hypothetical protein